MADISVIIPNFKMSALLRDAVASIMAGSVRPREIIVVDGGEDPGVFAALADCEAKGAPVRLLSTVNRSPANSRNIGLQAASSAFVQFLDADDLLTADSLEWRLQRFESDLGLRVVGGFLQPFSRLEDGVLAPADPGEATIGFNLAAFLFRRSLLAEIGPLNEDLLFAEDRDFVFRLIESKARIVIEPRVAYYYRRHAASLTAGDDPRKRSDVARATALSLSRRRRGGQVEAFPPLDAFVEGSKEGAATKAKQPRPRIDYHGRLDGLWRRLMTTVRWDPASPHVAVEIGTYEGSSALWMLDNMLTCAESRLYCIDVWSGPKGAERLETFRADLAERTGSERVEIMRAWSHEALSELARRGVETDLLYVDGAHDAASVLRDLVLGFEIVRVGGLVICDDYLWADPEFGGGRILGRPKIALDAFTTIYADKIRVLRGFPNLQVYFEKIAA